MTDLSRACPATNVQAMGAVRAAGLNWVAVLKRDPHAPGFPEQIGMPRAEARGSLLDIERVLKLIEERMDLGPGNFPIPESMS